jgi:integrase/recombinase XerC
MTIPKAIEEFLESLETEGRSPHTLAAYRRDLVVFAAFAKHARVRNVGAVTPQLLQRFIAHRSVTHDVHGNHRAPASINRYRVTLKALYAFLERRWLVPRNPTAILRCQRHRALPPDVLTEAEVEHVLAFEYAGATVIRDRAFITFMLLTGCRLAETVALNISDIDTRTKAAILRQPKGGDPERVVLSERVLAALAPLITRAADSPLFATHGRRLCCRQVQRLVVARVREAGIDKPITAHSLRHTFATRLYNRTGDIRLVQLAMRHQHVTTTECYAQVDPLRWRAAINAGATSA